MTKSKVNSIAGGGGAAINRAARAKDTEKGDGANKRNAA
jgi:hypothetical protein